ncbi:alpha/beta hydrolase [Glycocaulis abyssi]|uniref:Alpha/beta hydrolase n=1 Tax=Glycocaulis abyssi TaxID=1433403 RepID=A0ABV9NCD0_9PROT
MVRPAFFASVLAISAITTGAFAGPLQSDIQVEAGNTRLAGTLTVPAEPPRALLVMITGSGPHGRDGVISGAPMFAELADALAAGGVATIRVDEAGVGESTGERTQSFRERIPHVTATLDHARSLEGFAGIPVGFYGHSEGASLAVLVAAERAQHVDLLVLAGAPGARGHNVWVDQQHTLLTGQFPHLDPDGIRGALTAVADASIAGQPEPVYAAVRALFELLEAPDHVYEDGSFEQYASRMASIEMADFLDYDPAPAFGGLQVPTLAVWGAIDRQTSPALNAPILERVRGDDPAYTAVVLPDQDHFFLRGAGLEPGEHRFGEMSLAPELPDAIISWLDATLR